MWYTTVLPFDLPCSISTNTNEASIHWQITNQGVCTIGNMFWCTCGEKWGETENYEEIDFLLISQWTGFVISKENGDMSNVRVIFMAVAIFLCTRIYGSGSEKNDRVILISGLSHRQRGCQPEPRAARPDRWGISLFMSSLIILYNRSALRFLVISAHQHRGLILLVKRCPSVCPSSVRPSVRPSVRLSVLRTYVRPQSHSM